MALNNIRHTARSLPAAVGTYHRSTLFEAADALSASQADLLAALKPFAHFAVQWQAKPIYPHHKTDDSFVVYAIQPGSEWAAELTLGDFRRALAAMVAAEGS